MIQSAVNAVNQTRGGNSGAKPPPPTPTNAAAPSAQAVSSAQAIVKPDLSKPGEIAKKTDAKIGELTRPSNEVVAEAIRKHRLKINGQERDVPESEVLGLAQMGLSAREKWEESSKMRKDAEKILGKFKNPNELLSALKELGYNDRQIQDLAQGVIADRINEEILSPEQKAVRQREADLKRREQEIEDFHKNQKQEQLNRMTDHWKKTYDRELSETLTKYKLPPDAYLIKKMAAMMQDAIENRIPATWDDIAIAVKPELFSHHQFMIQNYEADMLNEGISKEVLKKLKKADLDKLKNPNKPNSLQTNAPKTERGYTTTPSNKPKKSWAEHRAKMERIKAGLE